MRAVNVINQITLSNLNDMNFGPNRVNHLRILIVDYQFNRWKFNEMIQLSKIELRNYLDCNWNHYLSTL